MAIRDFAVRVAAPAAGMVKRGEAVFIPRSGVSPLWPAADGLPQQIQHFRAGINAGILQKRANIPCSQTQQLAHLVPVIRLHSTLQLVPPLPDLLALAGVHRSSPRGDSV